MNLQNVPEILLGAGFSYHLFDCTGLNDLRSELLPQKPDITNTLYGTPEQLENTHKYYVMAQS